MVNHLTHFEDLYFIDSTHISKLANRINEKNFEASVKWDGSPSIVVGNDGRDFVSTKSFFNKSPIIYYDEREMESLDEGLRKKLSAALESVRNQIEEDHIYQGDLLFHEVVVSDGSIAAQPNVVSYRFKNVNDLHRVGIAWHTQLKGSMPFTSPSVYSLNSAIDAYMLTFKDDKISYDIEMSQFYMKHGNIFIQYHNYCVRNRMQIDFSKQQIKDFIESRKSAHIMKLKTQAGIQRAINHYDEIYSDMVTLNLSKHKYNMMTILDEKFRMMEKLHDHALHTFNVDAYIDGVNSHEGYVLTAGDLQVKLVMRELFSIANFEAHK